MTTSASASASASTSRAAPILSPTITRQHGSVIPFLPKRSASDGSIQNSKNMNDPRGSSSAQLRPYRIQGHHHHHHHSNSQHHNLHPHAATLSMQQHRQRQLLLQQLQQAQQFRQQLRHSHIQQPHRANLREHSNEPNSRVRGRLRGVANYSSLRPNSSMAVRRNASGAPSLAAIAGPMGIAVLDLLLCPHRPLMLLNFCSGTDGADDTLAGDTNADALGGGITSMAFQPCPSVLQCPRYQSDDKPEGDEPTKPKHTSEKRNNYSLNHNSNSSPTDNRSSILLAAARGNSILIWDASGRSLSPLLGRLNASDSWENGLTDAETHQSSPPSPNSNQTNAQSSNSIASSGTDPMERKLSAQSTSSSQGINANPDTNVTSNVTATLLSCGIRKSRAANDIPSTKNNNVTSLAWKGPSIPILLSTCGPMACLWDLRTNCFDFRMRPTTRYFNVSNGRNTPIMHCTYAHDESLHSFATLDSSGVVRVYDDRKCPRSNGCLASFDACPGGAVGIAALPPSRRAVRDGDGMGGGSRWVTWGFDAEGDDDLVVKVWTESSAATTPAETSNESLPYIVTSRISSPGAIAARIHPSFADGILLFRTSSANLTSPALHSSGESIEVLSLNESPRDINSPQTKVSPPSSPLLLQQEEGTKDSMGGWYAELWSVGPPPPLPSSPALRPSTLLNTHANTQNSHSDSLEITRNIRSNSHDDIHSEAHGNAHSDTHGAHKIITFRGGREEDSLLLGGCKQDANEIIAVDLAAGMPSLHSSNNCGATMDVAGGAEGEGPKKGSVGELLLCCLASSGRLSIYGIPEALTLIEDKDGSTHRPTNRTNEMKPTSPNYSSTLVYRSGNAPSWWIPKDLTAAAPNKPPVSEELSAPLAARGVDHGSVTQFDVDITTPFDEEGSRMNDSLDKLSSSAAEIERTDMVGVVGGVVTSTSVESGEGDAVERIDSAEAARVPCPPLCGVAFGGMGGIVAFHNGPIQKLWSWYQSTPRMSPTGRDAFHMRHDINDTNDNADEDEESRQNHPSTRESQRFPRSMFDLIEMSSSAKIAQWGEDENDDNAEESSNEDDEDVDDDDDDATTASYEDSLSGSSDEDSFYESSNMFDSYFLSSRGSLLGDPPRKDSVRKGREIDEHFAGLPSLSPSVVITRRHEDVILNGQTAMLAQLLQLGDCWWLRQDFTIPDSYEKPKDWGQYDMAQRNPSDPYLSSNHLSTPAMERSSSFTTPSSKQRSMMGNLKKLFSYQTTLTPPDQRLIKGKSKPKKTESEALPSVNPIDPPLGVYIETIAPESPSALERLALAHKFCLQNAAVYQRAGQPSKADTWTLLAQTVHSLATLERDEFDGWGGDDDALTRGVVGHILRYYELQGDYQMLSTIICVLTFGRDRRCPSREHHHDSERYQLLPKLDRRRFDNYLHRYAAMLYGWGMMTVRCEVYKRLAHGIPGAGAEIVISLDRRHAESGLLPNPGVAPGVTFAPLCRRCMEPVTNTDVCHKCREHAFQCSICCTAVRGLCIWCPLCGHGGHVDHIMSWFQTRNVCPTGCGCVCMLDRPTFAKPQIAMT